MSLRVLLALLFVVSLVVIFSFLGLTFELLYNNVVVQTPSTINNLFGQVSPDAFVTSIVAFLVVLIGLLYLLFFLIIDRFFVYPVRKITQVLREFSEHGVEVKVPPLSLTTKEVTALSVAVGQFADAVEQVHKQDLEISRVKSDFISTAAHQIRTPLTGIRWALEALMKENLTEQQRMLVTDAVSKSHDLVDIIGTLLDISSIESGKYKYTFESYNIRRVLEQVAFDFTKMAEETHVTLSYTPPETELPMLTIDHERIKWVLNNLVENAIKYTPAGGSVQIKSQVIPGRVLVKVQDTGIGIPSQDRSNIFERFYRAGNAISKENKGNGLGLYIARTIANDHGGDLNFESNKAGPGTTFTLSLPIPAPVAK